jgi:hypothetical protein
MPAPVVAMVASDDDGDLCRDDDDLDTAATGTTTTTSTEGINDVMANTGSTTRESTHGVYCMPGHSVFGSEFQQIDETRGMDRSMTYVIRHVLFLCPRGGKFEPWMIAAKVSEPPDVPSHHLSNIMTSEQWQEFWSLRFQPILDKMWHSQKQHGLVAFVVWTVMGTSVVLNFLLALKLSLRESQWPLFFCLACLLSMLIVRQSSIRITSQRQRCLKELDEVCTEMEATFSLRQLHGWSVQCDYEQRPLGRGSMKFQFQGIRLYFLPVESTTVAHANRDDVAATADWNENPSPTLAPTELVQNGYIRIPVSSCFKNGVQTSSVRSFVFGANWTPLVLEEPSFPADIFGTTSNPTNSRESRAGWSSFWVEWKEVANRYNWAHCYVWVSSAICGSLLFAFFVRVVVGTFSSQTVLLDYTFLAFLASLAVEGLARRHKAKVHFELTDVVQKHCFVLVQHNMYMEFRTVANFDHRRRPSIGDCVGGGCGRRQELDFVHCLYFFRIPTPIHPLRPVTISTDAAGRRHLHPA